MKYAILVTAIAIVVMLVIGFNNRTAQLNLLTAEQETAKAQVAMRELTKAALQTQIAYATSEAAVLEYGYNNHLLRPGDVAVVPVQVTQVTPTPVAIEAPQKVEMTHLEQWLLLIFGPQ